MSAPIAIRRPASPAASVHMGSPSSSPSGPVYVPLHRRTPSDASSSLPGSSAVTTLAPPPRAYTPAALLALCPPPAVSAVSPFARDIQERIRAACPEVLLVSLTSRARKSAAFNNRRTRTSAAAAATAAAKRPVLKTAPSALGKAKGAAAAAAAPAPTRVPARRIRTGGRGPERRRAALFSDNWRTPRVVSQAQAV